MESTSESASSEQQPSPPQKGPEKTCGTCQDDSCSVKGRRDDETDKDFQARQKLQNRMCSIGHKILVLSGKGGVGKSTVAVNLAVSLSLAGKRVGLLDVDIHGPSVPKMLQLENRPVSMLNDAISPIEVGGLRVMSIGFLLRGPDEPVIWRGPVKMGAIRQFLGDVEWGELDYLVIDFPPGTGDEPLSVCQLIEDADGAVIVTTPQDVATADVRRCINFCRTLELPVLGVVENMSGFVCPKCGDLTHIFRPGGGQRMAQELEVPFLGSIPIDPEIGAACDDGVPYVQQFQGTETAKAFLRVVRPILSRSETVSATSSETTPDTPATQGKETIMRIAIPVAEGQLCMHFGHCEKFAFFNVDAEAKTIETREDHTPPPHQPGVLPRWLAENEVNLVIAGGMGMRAQNLFTENGIQVIVGAPSEPPENLVAAYLEGTLESGENICDH